MRLSKFHTEIIPFTASKIDRATARIIGTVAMQVGEARGHDMWADELTLQTMAALGNARNKVMMRFGHPGMSENAFGKKLALAENFRVEGDRLLHDVQLQAWARKSPVFAQDPVEYILERAEKGADSFGESVVITLNYAWKLDDGTEALLYFDDEDGKERRREKPENVIDDRLWMRPEAFHFVDFVGDGALTPNGLFSAEDDLWQHLLSDTAGVYAAEAFDLLDNFSQRYGFTPYQVKEKATAVVNKWIIWKEDSMSKQQEPETSPVEEPTPEPIADDLDIALAAMDDLASDSDADEQSPSADSDETEAFVSRREYEALEAQLNEAEQQVQALQAQFTEQRQQLAAYLEKVNQVVADLSAKVDAINEQELGVTSIGARSTAFASLGAKSPQPPKGIQPPNSQPSTQIDAMLGSDPMNITDPVERAIALQGLNEIKT